MKRALKNVSSKRIIISESHTTNNKQIINERMKKYLFFLFLIFPILIFSQDTITNNSFIVLKYENGIKSSEGLMRDGKPDGYWKTYNRKGVLISEGNRKEFLLDSLWKFYIDDGSLLMTINYKEGKKEGKKYTYLKDEVIEEYYENDIKQKNETHYNLYNKIRKIIPFVNGVEEGFGKEYDDLGNIILLTEYSKGYILKREYLNRTDNRGYKQGLWKTFYENNNVKNEVTYLNNKKNGIYKEYDKNGNLIKLEKYNNDILIVDAVETKKLETKIDYHKNGKIKVIATYYNGVPEGIRREYNEAGVNIKSYMFQSGHIMGKGVLDDNGLKQGLWEEYYDARIIDTNNNSIVRAKGKYKNSKPIGEWEYFFPNGKLEQIGFFDEFGRQEGQWFWYYPDGEIILEVNYSSGKKEGQYIEYDEKGNIIVKGSYIEDNEDGFWFRVNGEYKEEGKYLEGRREGYWKGYYSKNQLCYECRYSDDNPDGKYKRYWENGRVKEEGNYILGKKNGLWRKYDENGNQYLVITYKNGIEIRYEGVKIEPTTEESETE